MKEKFQKMSHMCRKLVMWFELLEAPAFLFARQDRQQRSLQGCRTPSRNKDRERERNT